MFQNSWHSAIISEKSSNRKPKKKNHIQRTPPNKSNENNFLFFQTNRYFEIDGPTIELSSISNAIAQHHHLERLSNFSDDEPLYDAVASDDDYAQIAPLNASAASVAQQQVMSMSIHKAPQKLNSIG